MAHRVITGGESIGRIEGRVMTVGMSTAAETIADRTRAVRENHSRDSIRHRDQHVKRREANQGENLRESREVSREGRSEVKVRIRVLLAIKPV